MKISEAKALQKGDTVFIFIETVKWEVVVQRVTQLSSQVVMLEVEWSERGQRKKSQRPQTAAYLTAETAKQIWQRSIPREASISISPLEINPAMIPSEIAEAARRVTEWMNRHGHQRWKLLGIQSRED